MNIKFNNKTCKVLYFEVCPINGYEIIKVIPECIMRKSLIRIYSIPLDTFKLDKEISDYDNILRFKDDEEYYLSRGKDEEIRIKILTIAIKTDTGGVHIYSFDKETLGFCKLEGLQTNRIFIGIHNFREWKLGQVIYRLTPPKAETLKDAGLETCSDLLNYYNLRERLRPLKGVGKSTIDVLIKIQEALNYLNRYEHREA